MKDRIEYLVRKLDLNPHPEGGFYKELYRSRGLIHRDSLPSDIDGSRNYCTSIYFLLSSENFSAFHRIKQDEIWHFYEGSTLYVHVIDPDGYYTRHSIGSNIDEGEEPQFVVHADR